MDIGSNVFLWR